MNLSYKNRYFGCLLAIALSAFVGCDKKAATPTPQSQLLSALQIAEWDISDHVGHKIRIEAINNANGKCEFHIKQDMRLVTQTSSIAKGVFVYVIDSSGITSTIIAIDPTTTPLYQSQKAGVLYEENGKPVITLTRIGT